MKFKSLTLFRALFFSFFALFFMALISCSSDDSSQQIPDEKITFAINEEEVVQGFIRIKFEPEVGESIEANLASTDTRAFSGLPELENLADNIRIKDIRRTFPHAGKFEARTRARGMHLWYDVVFEQNVSVTRAATDFGKIDGIQIIEAQPVIRIMDDGPVVPLSEEQLAEIVAVGNNAATPNNGTAPAAAKYPFNDTYLPQQWHYANDGSLSKAQVRADINVIDAWRKQTGHPEVIVSVVDGGFNRAHPDLAANCWINEAELNGVAGVDDDNNGYVDDTYGWNFTANNNNHTEHSHGVHVAGTVAAVNNNGMGVGGVAGGDGTSGSGVRIMSCQIFSNDTEGGRSSAAAIKFGADNGAVISQNSWGYSLEGTQLEIAVKEAIDYFIEFAGIDENGVQTGPMKGGVVIFASGNAGPGQTGHEAVQYPGSYEPVINVCSMAPNYAIAYYAIYGETVDIMAPGGDAAMGNDYQVLSTLPGASYGFMQGTSMACPHVSGVAALMVSEYGVGHPGYTPEDLRNRLLSSVNNIYTYNQGLQGKLGSGYVDAAKCLWDDGGVAPEPVTDLAAASRSNDSMELTWSLTADTDMYAASEYIFYMDTSPFNEADIADMNSRGSKSIPSTFSVGDRISHSISGLREDTRYYFAIIGRDIFGNRSSAAFADGVTAVNGAPEVEVLDPIDNIVLGSYETATFRFRVTDPDGDKWEAVDRPKIEGVTVVSNNNGFEVQIKALGMTAGKYASNIDVIDQRGATTQVSLEFEILSNSAPVIIKEFENIQFEGTGETKTFVLSEYFSDPDDATIYYESRMSVNNIVSTGIDRETSVLTITSLNAGQTDITIYARDIINETTVTFTATVGGGSDDPTGPSKPLILYPNPATDKFYIEIDGANGPAAVKLYNATGMLAYDGNVTITPSQPGVVEISSLSQGSYTVVAVYQGVEYRNTVVKI